MWQDLPPLIFFILPRTIKLWMAHTQWHIDKTWPFFVRHSSPTIGRFNKDSTPDVLLQINKGVWWLGSYNSSKTIILDGTNGKTLWTMMSSGTAFNSPLTVLRHPESPQGDIFLFWKNGRENDLQLRGKRRQKVEVKVSHLFGEGEEKYSAGHVSHRRKRYSELDVQTGSASGQCMNETRAQRTAMLAMLRARMASLAGEKGEHGVKIGKDRANNRCVAIGTAHQLKVLLFDNQHSCQLVRVVDFLPTKPGRWELWCDCHFFISWPEISELYPQELIAYCKTTSSWTGQSYEN